MSVAAGDNEVTITWQAPAQGTREGALPTSYRIAILPGTQTQLVKAPATSARIVDLRNGVRYGFTVTAINALGESAASVVVEATPSSAVEGEVDRLIVAYEPGVRITEAPGVATGSSTVDQVELEPGNALGTGMRTVVLSEAVDKSTAEEIASDLTADPRVKWAEPDYFVPILQDGVSPQGLPAKSGPPQPVNQGTQSTKGTSQALAQASSADVGAQTACTASSSVEPIARCFDDSDYDAGSSIDGEIVWSDAYVAAGNRSTLLLDVVPWAQISDPNWLLYSHTYVMGCLDANGDSMSDNCIIPRWAALNPNQSTGVTIYDRVNGAWSIRASTCSGTLTRRSGDHAAIGGTANSWWQFSVDWSCLLGPSTSNVRSSTYLRDSLYPSGDYSPDVYAGLPMNFATMTNATTPAAPTGVGLAPASGSLVATWSAPASDGGAPISGYTARAFTAASGGSPIGSCTATALTCTIPGLAPGSTAWVDVVAANVVGAGAPSAPRTSGVPGAAAVPGSPSSLTVAPSSGTLTVRWGPPASDGGAAVTSYVARAFSQSSAGTAVASCTAAVMQCSISGLVNGQSYWVDVTAANAIGSGSASAPRIQASPAVTFTPTDPYYTSGSLWGLNGTYGVNAPDAWAITRGSASTVVAVLDTGSTVHPDLAGTTVAGYDMIADPAVAADGGGRDADPSDAGDAYGGSSSSWHGTHVAGTINALASNGVGVVGVAPEVKVQHVRVLGAGGGYTSDILAGITWASGGSVPGVAANPTPAKVINMSLGGYGSCGPDWQTAINAAVTRGTTIAVAAGNSASDASGFTPASCSNVVTVAAIASTGKRASFSNYGSMVEVAAPGAGIWSTLNSGTTTPGSPSYAAYSGTSMATPHVAGVIALMVSREPGLTPAQVATRLTTASLLTAFPGGACDTSATMTCGRGIVNAGKLLGAGSAPAAVPPGAPTSVAGTSGLGQVTVTWAAPASDGGSAITGYAARAYTALTGGTAVGSCTGTATSCVISGLASGVTYYLDVTATNSVGSGPASSPRASAAPATVPGVPSAVLAASAPGSASITWSAPVATGGSSITGYVARAFAAATGGSPMATCAAAITSCTISGLVNGTTVYVDVVATNLVGTGAASTPRVAVTPRTIPGVPTAVVANGGNGQVTASWAAPASNGGSPITGSTARAFTALTGGTLAASCTTTGTSCVIGGLANGTTYYVEVAAANAVGTGAPSTPRVAVTPRTTPGASTGVLLTPGAGQLGIAWTAPASTGGSPITGYTARAFTAATGGSPVASCTITGALTCVIGGLVNGTTYYVDAIATNAAGDGANSSPRVAGVPRTVPGSPANVAVKSGNGQLAVTWVAPATSGGSAITGYAARAFTASSGGTVVRSCTTTGALGCTIPSLVNGTTYYVEVVASNAAGTGLPSSPRVTGVPMTVPNAVRSLAATAQNAQVLTGWQVPAFDGGSPITGYTVRAWSAARAGTLVSSCTAATTSCTVPGLVNGTTYFLDVVAVNAVGDGQVQGPRVAVVPRTVPSTPTAVQVVFGNGTLAVSWAAPAANGGSPITAYTARAFSDPVVGSVVSSCTSAKTACVIGGLANGTTYHVEVTATNAVGASASSGPRVASTPQTVPGAPGAVAVSPGAGQVAVSWSAPAISGGTPITGYVARAFPSGTSRAVVASCATTGTSCAITGLSNGATYVIDVVAVNTVGTGAASSRPAVIPRTVPSAPSRVQAVPGNGTLAVSWAAPTSNGGAAITGYTARAVAAGSVAGSCAVTTTACTITGLSNGTSYVVEVVASNAAGSSAGSPQALSVPRMQPSAPQGVKVTPGSGQLVASWSPPATDGGSPITGYTARAWSATGGGTVVRSCTVTGSLTCTLAGLAKGVSYHVDVVAMNAAGAGAGSTPRQASAPR